MLKRFLQGKTRCFNSYVRLYISHNDHIAHLSLNVVGAYVFPFV